MLWWCEGRWCEGRLELGGWQMGREVQLLPLLACVSEDRVAGTYCVAQCVNYPFWRVSVQALVTF